MGEDLPEEYPEFDPAVQYATRYDSYDDIGGDGCQGTFLGSFAGFKFGGPLNTFFAAGGNCSTAILHAGIPPGVKSQILTDVFPL